MADMVLPSFAWSEMLHAIHKLFSPMGSDFFVLITTVSACGVATSPNRVAEAALNIVSVAVEYSFTLSISDNTVVPFSTIFTEFTFALFSDTETNILPKGSSVVPIPTYWLSFI